MITKLTFTNLKTAGSKTYDLPQLAVITGENFTGKTAIFQAIQLACMGHLPSLGKTNPATFQLSSGSEMAVSLQDDTGAKITRTWKQSGKSIKGGGSGDPPRIGILNAETFIAAKPADRLLMLAEGRNADMDGLLKHLKGLVAKYEIGKGPAESLLEFAERIEDELGTILKATKARKEQFEETLRGLSELAAGETMTEAPPDLLTAWKAAQAALPAVQHASNQAEAEFHAAQDAADWMETNAEPERVVELDIAAMNVLRDKMLGTQRALDAHSRALAEARAMVQTITDYTAEDEERRVDLEAEALNDWGSKLETLTKQIQQTGYERELSRSEMARAENLLAEIEHAKSCPFCKASGTKWKAPKMDELSTAVGIHGEDIRVATEQIEKMEASRAEMQSILNAIRDELPRLRSAAHTQEKIETARAELPELEDLQAKLQAQADEAKAAWDTALAAQQNTTAGIRARQEWEARAKLAGTLQEKREAHEKALQARMNAEGDAERIQEEYEAGNEARIRWAAIQAREADIATARENMEKDAEKQKALALDQKELAEVKATELRKLYEPVVVIAKAFSDGILPSPLDLHPVNGQIGRYNGTAWITFEAMSGSEQLVAVASLQAALAQAGGGILMLDEVQRMTPETKAKFIERITEAVYAKQISQALVIDHSPGTAYPIGRWQIIAA